MLTYIAIGLLLSRLPTHALAFTVLVLLFLAPFANTGQQQPRFRERSGGTSGPSWEEIERRRLADYTRPVPEALTAETRRRLEEADNMVWNPDMHRWETPDHGDAA
jgi:hypothetical protein